MEFVTIFNKKNKRNKTFEKTGTIYSIDFH